MKPKRITICVAFILFSFIQVIAQESDLKIRKMPGDRIYPDYFNSHEGSKLKLSKADSSTSAIKPLPLTPSLALRFQKILKNNVANNVSAAILFPNGDIWEGAKGYSHDSTKITTATVFNIGGITTTFVAATLLKMADEGKLSLDDSIYKFLPTYKYVDSCITVRMLLNHSSGLYDFTSNDDYWNQISNYPNTEIQPEQVIKKYLKPPDFPTGKGMWYSNTNFLLAGMVVSKITGENVSVALRKYTFDPFKLGSTSIYPERPDSFDVCEDGYFVGAGSIAGLSSVSTAGAVMSTPHDLVNWAKNLYQGNVFSDTALEQMITTRRIYMDNYTDSFLYGLGFIKSALNRNGSAVDLYGLGGGWSNESNMGYIPVDSVAIAACYKNELAFSLIQNLYGELMGVRGPVNDSICNAIELHQGLNGPFNNFNSSVEENEPCPPLGYCGIEGYWCNEFRLQQTVWFWFTAVRRDSLTIAADGFNNRIAVYEADSAAELLSGKGKILGASDDYNYTSVFPFINNLPALTIGKKYWLQLDGSTYRGEGIFNIWIRGPKYFRTSMDTVILGCDSNSVAHVIIQADTTWQVTTSNGSWIGFTPKNGFGKDTITIFSKTANKTGKPRNGRIYLHAPYIETKTIFITQQHVTSIDEPGRSDGILLYPNPISTELNIKGLDTRQLASCTFIITDISGRVVKKLQPKNTSNIDVSGLSKGLYFIEIVQDRYPATVLKFLKE